MSLKYNPVRDPGLEAHLQDFPDIPPLPPGFTLDADETPQGGGLPPLPKGFTLDALRPTAASTPPRPNGRITQESIEREIGPFNPLKLLKHPEVASTAIRTVPALVGGLVGSAAGPVGAAAGGAAGSALGYAADQWRTGREVSAPVLTLEALLGAIPVGKTASTVVRNIGKRALQGAGLGAAGGAARVGLEEQRAPTLDEFLTMIGTGGLMGGALGGGEFKLFGPRPAPPLPPPPPSGPRALRGPIAALPPATNPPTVDASPLPGLSATDIFTAQRRATKRGRAIDAKNMKEAMEIAEKEAKDLKVMRQQPERTVVLPRPWESLPDAPTPPQESPEALLFRSLRSTDYPAPTPMEQPAGMNVLEAVDRWNPRAVAMRAAIEEAERLRQSPASGPLLRQDLAEQQARGLFETLRGKDFPAPPPSGTTGPLSYPPVTTPIDIAGMKAAAHGGPAIEAEMVAVERLRQSAAGRDALRRQLAQATAKQETPATISQEPPIASPVGVPATPARPDIAPLVAQIDTLKSAGKTVPMVLRKELANARKIAKGQMATTEPPPTAPVETPVLARMHGLRNTIEDARSTVPTGKQFYRDAAGNVERTGNAGALLPRFYELFPELRGLDPKITPKQLVTAIDKDKGNKVYLEIQDLIKEQMAKETANPSLTAERPAEFGDFEAFSKAWDEVAAQEPIPAPPTGIQPKLFETQAEIPPTPLQAKTPQVAHENLLEGFRPQEATPPELPLKPSGAAPPSETGIPSGTTELGMGLQIPKGVKERVRRWTNRATIAYAPADRPEATLPTEQPRPTAGVRHRLGTIFDRALGQGEGKKFADMVDYSEMWTERDNLRFSETPLLKLSETELVNAMQAGEGRARPLNARVAQFVQDSKAYLSEKSRDLLKNKAEVLEDAIYEAGAGGAVLKSGRWRPYQPLANYFFQQGIDFTRAAKYDVPTLTRFLRRDIPDLGGQGANEMAEAIIAQAKGRPLTKPLSGPVEQILRRAQPTNPSLHARTGRQIPDEIRILPDKSIPLYVDRINKDLAALQTYGPRDAGIENVITRAFGERRGDAPLAKEQWDIWRGRNVLSPAAQSVSWWQRTLNNIVSVQLTGPLTAIRQTSQIGPVATMLPPKHLAQGLASAFTKSGWRGAQFAGALTSDMMEELSRQRTLGETISHAQTGTEKALAVTGRAAQVWGQATGQRFMDAYFRVVAQAGAKSWFRELQTDALAGQTKALAELKRWGLTPTSAGDELLVATKRASDYANRRAGPQNMPVYYYQKGGLGELSRHLNSFSMSSANYVLDGLRSLTSAMGRGDSAETIRMLKLMAKGAVILQGTGEVLGDVIRTAQGRPDDRPGGTPVEFVGDLAKGKVPTQTVINRIVDNYLFSGPLAMLNNLKEAVFYVQGGPRESQARLISQIVGPGISSTVETAAKAGDVIRKELAGAPPPDAKRDPRVESRNMFAREVVRKFVPGGQVVAPIVMPASKSNVKKRTVAGFTRAERRNNPGEAMDWLNWYQESQGKPLSPRTIRRGLQEAGQ